jgi:hypothetical protein
VFDRLPPKNSFQTLTIELGNIFKQHTEHSKQHSNVQSCMYEGHGGGQGAQGGDRRLSGKSNKSNKSGKKGGGKGAFLRQT